MPTSKTTETGASHKAFVLDIPGLAVFFFCPETRGLQTGGDRMGGGRNGRLRGSPILAKTLGNIAFLQKKKKKQNGTFQKQSLLPPPIPSPICSPLRGPAAILFISRDSCSDSVAKLFCACFFNGVSHNYLALRCKMGYRADVPV